MITNLGIKIKVLNQEKYNEFLNHVNLHKLTCSCGMSGQLTKHAYYDRHIKTPKGLITLRILRIKCNCCGKTHALFPQYIVPYSQILLNDHISIIKAYNDNSSFESIMMTNESIDESNINYIIKQYLRYWKERIAAFKISLDLNMSKKCLKSFKRQFMQIKCVQNILSL